ncbi:3811_t:CDS:2 [Ambispora gerdemannii]|uniref:3811_t:CDS:1 n=1 Tax=Ambispora gerdemannii TaxID=144530 RepID=A0A9N9FH23_9GLOM|nr:3811_t:CDS:2 [Ambispora gerdemannii]
MPQSAKSLSVNITDTAVEAQSCHNMEYLDLDDYMFITDSSICDIACSYPNLQHLDLSARELFITDIAIKKCSNLKIFLRKIPPPTQAENSSLELEDKPLNDTVERIERLHVLQAGQGILTGCMLIIVIEA